MSSTNDSPPGTPFRIAIIGGAIGGLSTALFLDNLLRATPSHRVEIDVYEQASEYREIGAGVGIAINAAKLLHTVPGVGAAMNSIHGGRVPGSWFTFVRGDNGKEIVHIEGPGNMTDEVRSCAMARNEFLDVLLGALRERKAARLHTKKKCVGVKVSFSWNARGQ